MFCDLPGSEICQITATKVTLKSNGVFITKVRGLVVVVENDLLYICSFITGPLIHFIVSSFGYS
ncbi:hypothetical protein D3C80_2050880 [compost metagenome]